MTTPIDDAVPEPTKEELLLNIQSVHERIATAKQSRTQLLAQRQTEATASEAEALPALPSVPNVRLVAVSKTKSALCVQNAYACGLRIFGENYAQELMSKCKQLPDDVSWHFIGHLQSNKAKDLVTEVQNLDFVETVDSEKLANKLSSAVQESPRKDRPLNVLIQVNTSGEFSKSGLAPDDKVGVLAKHIVDKCPGLKFRGLMTIGMPDFTSRPQNFICLWKLRVSVAKVLDVEPETLELSMGMSGDFENAIVLGSTNVRVGSTLFGVRKKKPVEE